VEPALGARAQRALLYNAATITGDRGSLESIKLLAESLTGFDCTFTTGKSVMGTTDESSFEGLSVVPGSSVVNGGTGRWFFSNSTLTRVGGDVPSGGISIARDPNVDDDWGPSTRFGIKLDAVDKDTPISMNLGNKIVFTTYSSGTRYADVTTKWQHGLEPGDKINLHFDGSEHYDNVTVLYALDPFTFSVDAAAVSAPLNSFIQPSAGYIDGAVVITYQGILVNPNTIYTLVGKFKGANRGDITLAVNYYDRFGAFISTQSALASALSPPVTIPPSVWTTVYAAGSSPANAAVATLDITQATNHGVGQYLYVDSLMLALGGTMYEEPGLVYETTTPYQGLFDYTFEDAHLLTITVNSSLTPNGQPVPIAIQADLIAVLQARLTSIIASYLPIGTAFVVNIV